MSEPQPEPKPKPKKKKIVGMNNLGTRIVVVTGPWDLVLRIRVRDHQHMRAVVFDKIWKIPGFRHSETMVSYETRDRPGGWNVALALEQAVSAAQAPPCGPPTVSGS